MTRLVLLLPLALLAACGDSAAPPPAALPPLSPETAVAQPAVEMVLAELPATVVQPPQARVAVAAPFAGMLREVRVQPGQAVRQGDVLATMISREALVLAGDLARAEAHGRLTAAEAARMTALAREGVVAGARADTAAAANAEAAINTREARRLLARAGADSDGIVRLRAPISGRVTTVAAAGAPVDGMTAPFVIEADGSRWLALALPEALAGKVKPGMALRTADGRRGRIETVAASLDPETRSLAARARLEDGGPRLTGGRLLGIAILAPAVPGAVAVPAAAVLADPAGTQVFVKTAKGFAPRAVTRTGTGAQAVITGGLKAGETVAVSNLPELRAVAGK